MLAPTLHSLEILQQLSCRTAPPGDGLRHKVANNLFRDLSIKCVGLNFLMARLIASLSEFVPMVNLSRRWIATESKSFSKVGDVQLARRNLLSPSSNNSPRRTFGNLDDEAASTAIELK